MIGIKACRPICLSSLFVYVLCFSACDLPPVSIDQISRASKNVVDWMDKTRASSQELADSIGQAHKDLSQYLNANNLSDETIKRLENTKSSLKARADKLKNCASNVRLNSNQLFSLLSKRAEENKTPQLKDEMFRNINDKKAQFESKYQTLLDKIKQCDNLIQEYDDLLGYIQVNRGLKGVDKLIAELEKCIKEAEILKRDVELAIVEGKQIVRAIQAAGATK